MAIRSAAARMPRLFQPVTMDGVARRSSRYFSEEKGRVLSEEERAIENVYIQKMERERLEKLRRKLEKEKAEAEKVEKQKKSEEIQKG